MHRRRRRKKTDQKKWVCTKKLSTLFFFQRNTIKPITMVIIMELIINKEKKLLRINFKRHTYRTHSTTLKSSFNRTLKNTASRYTSPLTRRQSISLLINQRTHSRLLYMVRIIRYINPHSFILLSARNIKFIPDQATKRHNDNQD